MLIWGNRAAEEGTRQRCFIPKLGEIDRLIVTAVLEDYAGYDTNFWGQHGVSFLIDVTLGNTTKRILFDTGQSSEPIIHNMKILGIDPVTINMIAISHCLRTIMCLTSPSL